MNSQSKGESMGNRDTLYTLDFSHKTVSQPIGPDLSQPERYKFVEIEVTGVRNPKRHPVIFEVHYKTGDGDKIFLGTFGLYPPDNPGTFIVATQGRLKPEGEIILSLLIPGKITPDDTFQVTVKKIRFREE